MKPIKFQYASQVVRLSNKFPARHFKPVRWGKFWALAKPDGNLFNLGDKILK